MPNKRQNHPTWADLPPSRAVGATGGGGTDLPPTANVGDVLTVVIPGVPTDDTSVAYLPAGGSKITSFTGISGFEDLGQSIASFNFAATANEVPVSASISWTGVASGGPQAVTPGLSMSGTITGPFVGTTNGQTLTATLTCVFADRTNATSQVATWTFRIISLPNGDTAANIAAANAAYLETDLTSFQLHAGLAGSYSATPTGVNDFPIALPTALGAPTFEASGFPVTPTFIKTVAGYVNPFGVGYSMDLYSFPTATNVYVLS